MRKMVGVRFKPGGKIYDFDCGALVLSKGDDVIVETEKGLGFGSIAVASTQYDETQKDKPLKKVYRIATSDDFTQLEKNKVLESQAHEFCLNSVKDLGLRMNLFSVESTFDNSRLTFFFTADGRVDFRQLVKSLVKEFRVRIEMRQVGIRNQAKMCGGIGRCGREFCCSSFLEKFEPVSIRMAKEQGLSLNPTKISGQCGRLMCCLTYENVVYQELKKEFPKIGKLVKTENVTGKVIRYNTICNSIVVHTEDGRELEVDINDLIT